MLKNYIFNFKKRATAFVLSLFLVCSNVVAQVPDGYYDNADGQTGFALKTALYNIIKDQNNQGYDALWGFYAQNELDIYFENDGSILDIYSENPDGADPYNFVKETNQCGNFSNEGDCYNREHSLPRSWFDDAEPMNSDVHHVFPTDGRVNGIRSNNPYGIVGTATQTSQNGSKLGSAAADLGYSGTVFEPIDEFKGDLARAYFYMATRYEDVVSGWSTNSDQADAVLDGSSDQVFEQWVIDMMVGWHEQDPVSQKEIDRNNNAFDYQGNRNPFVDRPEYVACIWGTVCPVVAELTASVESFSNFGPINGAEVSASKSYTLTGTNIEDDVTISTTENFEVSLDDMSFGQSITLTPETINDNTVTIFIRFAPGVGVPGNLTGELLNKIGGVQVMIPLAGIETTPDDGKTDATVTLSNLTQIADGTSKSVTVATDPAGLASYVLYDGVADAPTAPGTYDVEAFVNHTLFKGSATGTLIIEEETVTGIGEDKVSSGFGVYQRFGTNLLEIIDKENYSINKIKSATILDISGKEVTRFSFSRQAEVDLSGYYPGIYFLKIESEKPTFRRKILVVD